jgi:hypothetical protein
MRMVKRLSKDEYVLLHDLESIISTATASINSWYETPSQRTRFRTWIMWNNLALMCHNAKTLHMALKQRQVYSGQSLLRILIEQFINMNYLYYTKNYASFVRYLYHGDAEFIDGVEKYRSFTRRSDYNGTFTEQDFDEIRAFRDESSANLLKYGHPLKKMPDLRTRANLVDKKNGNYELEQMYIGWYITNSTGVHSSKDILISMTYANSLDELITGYTGKDDASRILLLANQLLSSAIIFAHRHTRARVEATPGEIDILRSYGQY